MARPKASMVSQPSYPPCRNARNVSAHADVRLQDGPTTYALHARRVFGEEQEQWWQRAYQTFPKFEQYRHAAGRDVPLYVLETA